MISPCALRATTVYIKPRASFSDYGEPVAGTTATTRGQVDERTTTARNAEGQEVRARATVILPASTAIAAGARLSVDGTDYYDVIEVLKVRALSGIISHLEVKI